MKRIPEKKIKDTFAKAHHHLNVIGSGLEWMETAVRAGDYPSASKAFGDLYAEAANELDTTITDDLARLCDAINPEIIAENERDATLKSIEGDLNGIGSALVVLKDAIQHTIPRNQGRPLNEQELADQLTFIDDLKWKVWNVADAICDRKHREKALSELEEIRSQIGVLANGYGEDDSARSGLCEGLRATAERAYVSFKTLDEVKP